MNNVLKNFDVLIIKKGGVGAIVDINNINDKHLLRRLYYRALSYYIEIRVCCLDLPPLIGVPPAYERGKKFEMIKIYFCSKDKIPWNENFFLGWYDNPKDAIIAVENYYFTH